MEIIKIRCEYRENPLGIGVKAPRISWQLVSDKRNAMQTAYQIQVSKDGDTFGNPVWDTLRVDSSESIHIEYAGEALESRTRYYYRIRVWDDERNISEWSESQFWETGLLKKEEWIAEWIAVKGDEPEACPYLRSTFHIRKRIKSARIYASALGLYEIHLNGKRAGDALLTPGWTSYHKRLQYQAYDVTDLLKEGRNAVGAVLGNGWYKGYIGWENRKEFYGSKRALLFQMHVTYEDGDGEVVISDGGWKSSQSPILMSEIYHGETYDARLEKGNWTAAEYDDSDWQDVCIFEYQASPSLGGAGSKDILVAQEDEAVKAIEEIKPVGIIRTPRGETVIDFGQNMVGWVRFEAEGDPGTEVVLSHAEVLDNEGNFYTENLRRARQTIRYILKGSGKEVFEPHFTFQGFRYVRIDEYPGKASCDNFTGIVIHTVMEATGAFECSDELVNQLQHNIVWGQKGNFVDIPTDCPQRDERLGWTGDAQMFARTACFNMNVAGFFTKWLRDLYADQSEEKGVPSVIPHVLGDGDYSCAAWGDAAVICPWTIYTCYGDKRILKEQYQSMKMWVEYIRRQGENEYLWNTGRQLGDWLGLDAREGNNKGSTAFDFIATAFYAYSTELLYKTAGILCYKEDENEYEALYNKIIESFRKEFVTPGGRLVSATQTACVLSLEFNLVEERHKKRTIETLAKLIEEKNTHLTTGFVGTPYLCRVLSKNGYNSLAYKLLLQKDYPSWLYQITRGATTVWEHWDGIREDGSFWDKTMNSFNHYAYGSIGDWLYRNVAGIDTDEGQPGYKHIHIKPMPGPGITYAGASLHTMYGKVRSAWYKAEGAMKVEVSVPANTTASIVLPEAKPDALLESGRKLMDMDGIRKIECKEDSVELFVGSGQYCFTY